MTDLQLTQQAQDLYAAQAEAIKAEYTKLNQEFNSMTFSEQESITGIILGAKLDGLQRALHTAQSGLFACISELTADTDI